MVRDRNDIYERREFDSRNERFRRERPWGYDEPYPRRNPLPSRDYRREEFGRGRFGERAEYDYDEPRYSGYERHPREEYYEQQPYDSRYYQRRESLLRRPFDYGQPARSRLRCRDIMTRDLVVATRDNTLREVAEMMKEEDTGVILVIDHQASGGNGRNLTDNSRTNTGYGRIAGLITEEARETSQNECGLVLDASNLFSDPRVSAFIRGLILLRGRSCRRGLIRLLF